MRQFCRLFLFSIFSFFIFSTSVQAQKSVNIALLADDDAGRDEFIDQIKTEIEALLGESYQLAYDDIVISGSDDYLKIENSLFTGQYDVIVSTGVFSSLLLEQRADYTTPTIAGLFVDKDKTKAISGIDNFTYIRNPFSFVDDIALFQEIVEFEKFAVFVPSGIEPLMQEAMSSVSSELGLAMEILTSTYNLDQDMQQLQSSGTDAIYILPYYFYGTQTETILLEKINELKIPSFALFGESYVPKGTLAGRSNATFIQNYARRIAVDILRILDGENAATFPVDMTLQESDLLLNMKTAKEIGVYPSFDVLSEATLLDLNYIHEDATPLNLQSAVLIALENNLEIRISERDVALQENTIKSTKSSLYPDLQANVNSTLLDNRSANSSPFNDELRVQGNLSLSQVILSEPLYAGIAIQKTLKKVEEQDLRQKQFEITENTAFTYLNYLLAKANVAAQQSNVEVTRKNLNLAIAKENIGSTSAADKYRFEAQLAQNSVSLNEAQKNLEQAKYALALLLNRPKTEEFNAADISLEESPSIFAQPGVADFVSNQNEVQDLSEFLIEYAKTHQPTTLQIDYSLEAQKRSLKSSERSLYLPQVSLNGGLNQTIARLLDHADDATLESLNFDPNRPTWNLSLNANLPIFQGLLRKTEIEKNKITIKQLNDRKDLVDQSNETIIRSDLVNIANSYGDVGLNEKSAEAARAYLDIILNLYQEGATTIAVLLDAQNSALNAELGLIDARYRLMQESFTLEKDIGFMYIISTEEERNEFIQAFQDYMIKSK